MTKGYRIVAAVIPIDDDQPSAASPFSQPWRRIMFLENQVTVDEMQRDGTDVVERECKRLGKKLASSVRKIGGALPWQMLRYEKAMRDARFRARVVERRRAPR